jgi:pre-mRNA-splicing factor SYF1
LDIWNTYLRKFLARYGGSKLERARDLLEQCLDGCPDKYAKTFFLLYANLEEAHGSARHIINVYEPGIWEVWKVPCCHRQC